MSTHTNPRRAIIDIEAADGIKLTKIGNFPRKMVIDIYDKKYLKDPHIERGIIKIRSENDWRPFHSLHISMRLGGLIRKYKSKVVLTKKCKFYLSTEDESGLFKEILMSFCNDFNWAYNDNYENQYTGQFGFLFLVHFLTTNCPEPRDLKFITDRYFKAFPTLQIISSYDSKSLYTTGDRAIETRFFRRFAEWFGFVDIHVDKSEPYFERKTMIVRTPILNNVIEYSTKYERC